MDRSSAWKQDFPNIQRFIVYQVQAKPCAMGPMGDQLPDVQRTLPLLFSNMSILSTIELLYPRPPVRPPAFPMALTRKVNSWQQSV